MQDPRRCACCDNGRWVCENHSLGLAIAHATGAVPVGPTPSVIARTGGRRCRRCRQSCSRQSICCRRYRKPGPGEWDRSAV